MVLSTFTTDFKEGIKVPWRTSSYSPRFENVLRTLLENECSYHLNSQTHGHLDTTCLNEG
jgi:hypothetical protein